jgi:hypothetical protein
MRSSGKIYLALHGWYFVRSQFSLSVLIVVISIISQEFH